MPEQPVLLVELERDLGAPADGWSRELDRRGVAVIEDDLGRPAVDRATARALFAEARSQQEAAAVKAAMLEEAAIQKDLAFRAGLPGGVPASLVPEGVTAGQLMMLADPDRQSGRRQSVLDHALSGGGIIFHPIREDAS
jgi:hypothetical protein